MKVRQEENVLFKDALVTFYLWLCGVVHMVKDHSNSERGNLLLPLHGFLYSINIQGTFYMHSPIDRIVHTIAYVIQLWCTGWNEKYYSSMGPL